MSLSCSSSFIFIHRSNPTHSHGGEGTSAEGQSGAGGSGEPAFKRQESNSLYVIQNPSAEGEEVFNMAIGIKERSFD